MIQNYLAKPEYLCTFKIDLWGEIFGDFSNIEIKFFYYYLKVLGSNQHVHRPGKLCGILGAALSFHGKYDDVMQVYLSSGKHDHSETLWNQEWTGLYLMWNSRETDRNISKVVVSIGTETCDHIKASFDPDPVYSTVTPSAAFSRFSSQLCEQSEGLLQENVLSFGATAENSDPKSLLLFHISVWIGFVLMKALTTKTL